jgi:DNA mismatch endonuclease, patch repair protein
MRARIDRTRYNFRVLMDSLTAEHRSWLMSRIGSKNTLPELAVRKIVWSLGYRYRLHVRALPGQPDIVVPRLKKIIEVRGCFWHRHGCKLTTTPKTKTEFWQTKFCNNVERDRRNLRMLRKEGWRVLVIWQCQLKNLDRTTKRIYEFLEEKTD